MFEIAIYTILNVYNFWRSGFFKILNWNAKSNLTHFYRENKRLTILSLLWERILRIFFPFNAWLIFIFKHFGITSEIENLQKQKKKCCCTLKDQKCSVPSVKSIPISIKNERKIAKKTKPSLHTHTLTHSQTHTEWIHSSMCMLHLFAKLICIFWIGSHLFSFFLSFLLSFFPSFFRSFVLSFCCSSL